MYYISPLITKKYFKKRIKLRQINIQTMTIPCNTSKSVYFFFDLCRLSQVPVGVLTFLALWGWASKQVLTWKTLWGEEIQVIVWFLCGCDNILSRRTRVSRREDTKCGATKKISLIVKIDNWIVKIDDWIVKIARENVLHQTSLLGSPLPLLTPSTPEKI